MSKRNKNQEVVFVTEAEEAAQDEPIFETEAYGTPRQEAGSDVTVTKPIGPGGPVPVVAPKHSTIQLQPIIIPLAVVPYMTQDSSALRTESSPQGANADTPTQFEEVERVKVKKRHLGAARLFAFISFALSLCVALMFVLSHFGASMRELDLIAVIQGWITSGFSLSPISSLLYIAAAAFSAVLAVCLLIGLIAGRYPRAFTGIFSFVSAGCLLATLIIDLVKKQFVAGDRTAFIAALCVSLVGFVASIIFSIILNKLEDRVEEQDYYKEI